MISRFLGDILAVLGIVGPTLATFILVEILAHLPPRWRRRRACCYVRHPGRQSSAPAGFCQERAPA